MTILDCQKRHHEPHWANSRRSPGEVASWCDGLPVWPHTRPKPPPINSGPYINYLKQHNAIAAWKTGKTEWSTEWVGDFRTHPTHTEAIMYAQKLAQERKQHGSQ